MWRIGFGLEKIGLAALRFPRAFTLFLILLTAFAVLNVPKLSFNGSVLAILPDRAPAFQAYEKVKNDYRNFSADITILVESDRLFTAQGLDDLRNLQLDLALEEKVRGVVSIFSVPDFDPMTGESREWFPEFIDNDEQARALIAGLTEKYPQAQGLARLDANVAVLIASLSVAVDEDGKEAFDAYRDLRGTLAELAPQDFKLSFTGLTAIGTTMLDAMLADQFNLTFVGLILGIAISFITFRNFPASILCAFPPTLTVIWTLGMFSYFGQPINYLTTILPSLAMILAFADGIFLYFRWQTMNAHNPDFDANLKEAVSRVGPASALTSITTALAFLSFAYAESESLKSFALLGAGGVTLAFLGVIIGLPIALHWAIRFGIVKPSSQKPPAFLWVGRTLRPFIIGRALLLAVFGIAVAVTLGVIQTGVSAEYKITQYLPKDSDTRYAESLANSVTGGRALLLLSVPLADDQGLANPQNRQRLKDVDQIASDLFGETVVLSPARILRDAETHQAQDAIADFLDEAHQSRSATILSKDGSSVLITIRLDSEMRVAAIRDELDKLKKGLSALPYGSEVIITGFPVLMSVEFTRLIDQLKLSLIFAITFGIIILGFATRSITLLLAATTPNLLPIFLILSVLYFVGGTVNLSEVVALTIAFGIAIDNAVHLINVLDSQRREGKETLHAISDALAEAGPALTAGSIIICVSVLVTQISQLPIVPMLGQLIIITLAVALLSNLLILPANILTLERIRDRFRRT